MNRVSINKSPHNKQRGVSLIEVLITILLMSIGALGVAAMQIAGLQYNSGAAARTQASLLANDILDRIRSNRQIALSTAIYNTNGFQGGGGIPRPPQSCYTNVCSANEMARYDQWAWLTQISSLLPSGQAEITFIEVDDQRIYSVTIQWRQIKNEERDSPIEELQQMSFRSAL